MNHKHNHLFKITNHNNHGILLYLMYGVYVCTPLYPRIPSFPPYPTSNQQESLLTCAWSCSRFLAIKSKRRFSLPLLLAQGSEVWVSLKHLGLRIENLPLRNSFLSIILRLCQMWTLRQSFFHVLYAKHLGISPLCSLLYYLF